MDKSTGFTLIELLVVISIIGLLTSVLLVAVNGARTKAVNARLVADQHQIVTQIESVRIIKNATMMGVTGNGCTDCSFTAGLSMKSQTAALTTNNTSWANLGFSSSPIDPWGNPYTMDENEKEFNSSDCRYDNIYSAGPDGAWSSGDEIIFQVGHFACVP